MDDLALRREVKQLAALLNDRSVHPNVWVQSMERTADRLNIDLTALFNKVARYAQAN